MRSFQSIEKNSIWLMVFCFQFITGCKNRPKDIPFPSEQSSFTQPYAEPVHLSVPRKMNGSKENFIKPEISKFDLNNLPASIYDSSDFIAFPILPKRAAFRMALLPSKPFSFQDLPSKAFKPQVSFLENPRLIKVERPHLVSSSSALIYEFGEPLIGTHVNCVLNDKAGFLWIATDGGIYRYDGENFLMIMSEILANGSKSMAEDRNGRIWVGTEGNGIMGIDNSSGTFIHITTRQGLACDDVSQILADSHGFLWLAESSFSFQEGIDIIDLNTLRIKHIGKTEGLSSNYITSIVQDQNENIWISNLGGSGINILDLKNNRLRYLNVCNGLKINAVTSLLGDGTGNIWIGTKDGKLNAINPQKEIITFYDSGQGLDQNCISSLIGDRKGNVWIGTGKYYTVGNGVEVLDPVGNRLKRMNTSIGLSANGIAGMAEDTKGQVWIASVNGLNMCVKNGSDIIHIGKSDMYCLSQDSSGLIWICTNHGLDVLDLNTGLVKSVTTRSGLRTNNMVNDLEMDRRMFVATMKGLEIFDPVKKTLEHIGEKQGLSGDKMGAMTSDRKGRIWTGFYPLIAGVDVLDPQKLTVEHLGKNQGIDTTVIMEIRQDYMGMIWLGHVSGAMEVIDPDKMTISKLVYDRPFSRSNFSDMSMENDARGNMWIGSDAGIYVVNAGRDSLFRISLEQGLIGNYILSLNRFGDQVYAGTKNGLSVFTVPVAPDKKWFVESFGNSDGFRKLADNFATDFVSSNGQFFWLDLGITHFKFSKETRPPPSIYITSINIINRPQNFSPDPWTTHKEKDTIWSAEGNHFYVSGLLPSSSFYSGISDKFGQPKGPYNIPSGLQLSYDSNHIQFRYALVNAGIGDAAHYRYILEGFDKNWSEPTTNSESPSYLNLQPGSYVFKVAGKGRNNEWSKPASFSFTILTPWWQSWWFYLLCFVTIILTFYSFYRFRINQILKVQAVRNRIAADLHDDIGSTLSSISIMSELAKVKSSDSLSLLKSIGESASAIQENMSDLVWVVNSKNDHFNNMVQRMKQFSSEILDAKSIAFHLICDEDVYDERLSMDQRKKVYLFFKEAINNAAKYSCAKQVNVHISSLNDQIILTIEDNGNGFNLNNGNSGNGLANFRRRADELKGIFSIHSAINEGTKIQLSFKIT